MTDDDLRYIDERILALTLRAKRAEGKLAAVTLELIRLKEVVDEVDVESIERVLKETA